MRWRVCVGVFILLYQLTEGKPIKSKQKSQPKELIREKRGELEDEEGGTNEMEKFILDLSAKEDMRRLKERFNTKGTRDVDDVEYRRLKRFSIHDEHKRVSPLTMETRASRTAKEDATSPNPSSFIDAMTGSPSSYASTPSFRQLESKTKQKRTNLILTRALSQSKANMKRATPASNSGSGSTLDYQEQDSEKDSSKKHMIQTHASKDVSEILGDKSSSQYEKNDDSSEYGNESDKNFEDSGDSGLDEDSAEGLSAGPPINYHLAGESWEIIHHNPNTGSLPSLTSGNTTIHREYLQDDVIDDEYKRVEKSRRKPRLSKTMITRSIEPEYEIQEISAVYKRKTESSDGESAHIIALNKKPIKSDGYIGCFVDKHPKRDLIKAFTVNDLTPDSCRSVCKEKDHAYAGMQYGYLCHCGDEYGKYGNVEDRECNSLCQGDEEKKCGGFWRNSIYVTDNFKEEDDERESRSHIDRIIPIPQSEQTEEVPVRQEITAYLRAEIPKGPDEVSSVQTVSHVEAPVHDRHQATETGSERTEIALAALQKSKAASTDRISYLHPQNIHRSFIPSTLNPEPGKYKEVDSSGKGNSDDEVPKDTREIPKENQLEEDRPDGIDPFLEEVFRQIK